jgi:hypothetical protein
MKAKIIRIHSINKRGILNTVEKDRILGEEITIHQYIKSRKRRMASTVSQVTDEQGAHQTDQAEILRIFTDHLVKKYERRNVNVKCMHHLLDGGLNTVPLEVNLALDEPLEIEEVCAAVRKGKEKQSPGSDGICNEFFKNTWDVTKQEMVEIINHMYMEREVTDVQKQGIIMCVPKKTHSVGVEDYRTLSLLNTDYKLLTRVIAQRPSPWMGDLLHPNKYCGKRGQPTFDAVAAVRDIIAYA